MPTSADPVRKTKRGMTFFDTTVNQSMEVLHLRNKRLSGEIHLVIS